MGTSRKLAGSVGRNGKNHRDDVSHVQDLLNEYILEGRLGDFPILDEPGAGAGSATELAIREFQDCVMHVPPTGKIVGSTDDTYLSLCKSPKDGSVLNMVQTYCKKWIQDGPPDAAIRPDMWKSALQSLAVHASHPRLTRYSMLTLVDFRIARSTPRLWVVDLHEHKTKYVAQVAHGKGSYSKTEDQDDGEIDGNEFCTNFTADYSSKLGAYIATWKDFVLAGQKAEDKKKGVRGPAVRLQGLDACNRMAARIGIIVHGAHYVKTNSVGNSRGCFATSFKDNKTIVELIKDGSFLYAYAGEGLKPSS